MTFNNSFPIYHVFIDPITEHAHQNISDMLELVKAEKLTKETYVWRIGMKNWVQAGQLKDLNPLFATPPLPEDTPELKKKIHDDLEDDRFEQRLNAKK